MTKAPAVGAGRTGWDGLLQGRLVGGDADDAAVDERGLREGLREGGDGCLDTLGGEHRGGATDVDLGGVSGVVADRHAVDDGGSGEADLAGEPGHGAPLRRLLRR